VIPPVPQAAVVALPGQVPKDLHTKLAGELQERTQGYLGDLKALLCEATISATIGG